MPKTVTKIIHGVKVTISDTLKGTSSAMKKVVDNSKKIFDKTLKKNKENNEKIE